MQMPVIMWQGKFKSLTLIEVLVAVSVAMLLLGVSIPLFSKNARNQNLINEAEAIAGFYSRARNYAFHPERIKVEQYVVDGDNCTADVCDQLVIKAIPEDSADPVEIDRISMPAVNIEVPGQIAFEVGSGKTNIAGTKTVKIYFKSGDSQEIKIEINNSGNIDVIKD